MGLDLSIYITYIGMIIMVFVFGKLFLWPLKNILRYVLNIVAGGILLLLINYFGQSIDLFIPFNILNACITGILGLPGVVLLLLLTT